MTFQRIILVCALVFTSVQAAAEEQILPVFALNAHNPDGSRWSTEIYLVNPTPGPIQVSIAGLLPGKVRRSTPCGQFMSQTRVVPPQSAVLWTASGLATDLGCADSAVGALKLHADGPVRVTGRMVHHPARGESTPTGILSGNGLAVDALLTRHLPGPTTLLLPTLLWHPNPCGERAFSTKIGFANPNADPVTVTIFLPKEGRRAIQINGRPVALPHQLVVEPQSFRQFNVSPLDRPGERCLEPESFDLELVIDGQLAVYGTVIDRRTNDGRIVEPVDLVDPGKN